MTGKGKYIEGKDTNESTNHNKRIKKADKSDI
jgi:hypothetical protein